MAGNERRDRECRKGAEQKIEGEEMEEERSR